MYRSLVMLAGSRAYRGGFAPSKSGRYLVQCDARTQNSPGVGKHRADSLSETFGPLHVSCPGHRSNWYPECIWWQDVIDVMMEREPSICGFIFPSLGLFSLDGPPMLVCLFYMYYIPVHGRLTKKEDSKLTNHTLCGTLREGYV